jgi:lysophospholipase L1-like esterase
MTTLRRRLARKLSVSAGALLLVLGAGELWCRAAGHAPSADYFRWIAHAELQAVPMPNQETWFGRNHPESGQTLIPIRINGYGQRGADYPLEKQAGERRIAVLGDSLTMGQGVKDGETYPAQLQRELTSGDPAGAAARVINAGVNGWSCWHYMRWAQTQLDRYRPDVLVVGLFLGNDAEPPAPTPTAVGVPLENALRNSALYQFSVKQYRQRFWKRVEAIKRGITVEQLERKLEEYQGLQDPSRPLAELQAQWERYGLEPLQSVRQACLEAGVELVILLLPTYPMLQDPGVPPLYAFVRERVSALGVPVVECREELRAGGRAAWLPWDEGHLSVAGNAAVARVLARELERLGLAR